jgi:hypothetical protein
MQTLLSDILKTEGVQGVALLSAEGAILFEHFPRSLFRTARPADWKQLIQASDGLREADMIFERLRLYVRKADVGYLLIFAETNAPMAMVRLNADLVLPSLKKKAPPKGLSRFFRSRK